MKNLEVLKNINSMGRKEVLSELLKEGFKTNSLTTKDMYEGVIKDLLSYEEVYIPDGYMNIGIAKDYLIADTNNSQDWKQLEIKLPEGDWIIRRVEPNKVLLQRTNL